MSKPIYRLPEADRDAAVRALAGRHVVVEWNPLRDRGEPRYTSGRLLGVARPRPGTVANMAIVDPVEGRDLVAISTATIISISTGALAPR